jgi:hypothetical protein
MDMVDLGRGRVVGIVIIAVTLAAIALLFAGQGPVVAAAALVGLIVGSVAGVVGLLWLRGGERSFAFVTPGLSPEPDEAFMEQMREGAEVMTMELGPVDAVRPVLATAETRGISIQLLSIEYRAAGATVNFEGRGSIGVNAPSGMPVFKVTDDVGTRYRVASDGQGGGNLWTRYQATFAPAPPADAGRLTITIERFIEFDPWRRRSTEGPWEFEVPGR